MKELEELKRHKDEQILQMNQKLGFLTNELVNTNNFELLSKMETYEEKPKQAKK